MPRDPAYFMRLTTEHSPTMLAYWDRELRCRFANPAYALAFGMTPAEMVGTYMPDLKTPDVYSRNRERVEAVLAGVPQRFELRLVHPNDVVRHNLVTYAPVHEAGAVAGFLVDVAEVGALRTTEAALLRENVERERAHQLLVESSLALEEAQRLGEIGSWEWDATSNVSTWSAEFRAILGYDPELPPLTLVEVPRLYSAQSWLDLSAAMTRLLETSEPYVIELQYVKPEGGFGWLESRGEAVRDGAGNIVKLHGTVQEISLRRRAMQDRIQREVAESASRNKTQLLSRVSHELRTPLNGILGFAQLLQLEPSLQDTQRHWADLVYESGQHMLRLVDQVLELSAAESGQMSLEEEELDVVALLRERMLYASRAAKKAGVKLGGLADEVAPIVLVADRGRVRQVVDDLFTHGIEQAAVGTLIVVAAVARAAAIELRFEDPSRVLSADQLARVFEPFAGHGGENTGFRKGLGLALTKNVVTRLGGTLEARSDRATGTRYVVTLPIRRVPATERQLDEL